MIRLLPAVVLAAISATAAVAKAIDAELASSK
jgi:hypothetical protein